ncbi:hypothetical protein [Bradyrhizobium sp. AS23.2]|uniref:hypothetical protein n=1 Tax=Bradyrhizobium sp. AS23.2 TaxID=1680155 RepID=UPI00094061F3|nr:hypothetical protein [Bradyrhizobium sp. AS23.2]OKO69444.1 hypothetical protein AC630_36795 [Bradyrhizobium sp. AS23.2]
MATTDYTHTASSVQATRDYDGWIIAGYGILGVIALAALYFASGSPGNGEAALAIMVAMP